MQELAGHLAAWFTENQRDLPWRTQHRDPYHVLVSELMLQQTQVERVVPRFLDFVARFPSLVALAEASEEEVLAAWSGLGYYRRARMLHRLSRQLVGEGRILPEEPCELERLPGIGPYTAAAVASLAHGRRAPVLDGNVLRVAARVNGFTGDPRSAAGRRTLSAWVDQLMEGREPGVINEALMELGALVCTPRSPRCGECPLRQRCKGAAADGEVSFPPPRRSRSTLAVSWVAACCVGPAGRWLLKKVDGGPILTGLWMPPLVEVCGDGDIVEIATGLMPAGDFEVLRHAPEVNHSITHRRITVTPVVFRWVAGDGLAQGWRWADPGDPELATSSLLQKLVKAVGGTLSPA